MVRAKVVGGPALVLVANTRSAHFLLQAQRFSEPEHIDRLEAGDIEGALPAEPSDQPGKAFDSFGAGRHKLEPPTGLRDEAAAVFAAAVAERLQELAATESCGGFIIIAAPRLLGLLRHEIERRPISSMERLEIPKDVVGADPASVGELISRRGGLQRLK